MTSEKHCCGPRRMLAPDQPPSSATQDLKKPNERGETGPGENVFLEGGRFWMGSDEGFHSADCEGPVRNVQVAPFGIDRFAVTNARFALFARATDYVTDAERYGWSFVFLGFLPFDFPPTQAATGAPWWRKVDGANWRCPEGRGSSVANRLDHPVVHVSWNDAQAFASWAGGRLPTETEWEFAARGGLERCRFPWGDREPTDDATLCNIWQGDFPRENTGQDGYLGTAPVDTFTPNSFGLYNMVGNVWEWCENDFVEPDAGKTACRLAEGTSRDDKAIRGGSYLCHRSYCYRYRVAARSSNSVDSSTGHMGFRIAYDGQ